MKKPIFIAEVKTQSPFGYKSDRSWEELFAVAAMYGDVIAIHTDCRWGGSFDLLKKARKLTDKPILAKGLHSSDMLVQRAVDCGANHVLVVGRVSFMPGVFIEPTNIKQMWGYYPDTHVVWNSRDLETGGLKSTTFADARQMLPNNWICQASNIRCWKDVDPTANAILVGTHLIDFVREL